MSKFKKAESWKEFYTNFNQYIVVLYESRDRDETPEDRDRTYDMLVRDWAEYCAVNKEYIRDGAYELENNINKQMIYLLAQEHEILTYFLDIFFTGKKGDVQDFSAIRTWINDEFAFQEFVNTPTTSRPTASTCVKKENCTEKYIDDSSVLIDFAENNFSDESFSYSKTKEGQEPRDLEQVVYFTSNLNYMKVYDFSQNKTYDESIS